LRRLWWGHGAKSGTGFEVRLKGLHDVEYRESDKVLTAFRERLVGEPSMELDPSSIESWNPPYQDESITPARKKQILENICAALDFLGLTYVIRGES
jgi:hypothetical protein